MQKSKFINLVMNPKFVLGVFILFAFAAAIGQYIKGHPGEQYTRYNNYIIFRESFHHLIHNIDLYQKHEPEHFDYYKYSPTFPVLMAPFAFLPDLPGLILWDLLNACILFFAIMKLPVKNESAKIYILWFILIESMTSMQNSQSNGLMAGLLVFAFNKFEKGNVFLAALFILISAYIKIYSVLAAILFLFYPQKIKFTLSTIFSFLILTFLPLLFIGFDQLLFLYKEWYNLLFRDYSTDYGISVLGILHSWFGAEPEKNLLLLIGLILLCLPLVRTDRYKEFNFRLFYFAAILIWIIIFNHRAESPTYIIAITGVAIWFFTSEKRPVDLILLITAFILTSLSPTDLFPRFVRQDFIVPYVLKALPCVLIWIKITADLMIQKKLSVVENS